MKFVSLLKTSFRFDPSIALNELAKVIGNTYDDVRKVLRDERKVEWCADPKDDPILKATVDDFGADKEKMWKLNDGCAEEYANIVKERTEEMFPVSLYKGFCNEAQGTPTGLLIFYDILFFYF